MNIVYCHQYFISQEGAGGTRSFENLKALVKLGHKVTLVGGDGKSGLKNDFVNSFRKRKIEGIDVI